MGKYDDIIDLEHHVSEKHKQMSREKRAAQFSPFAALTGFGGVIKETERITYDKPEISDEKKYELNIVLNSLMKIQKDHPFAEVVYYEDDERKKGGNLFTYKGDIKKIDPLDRYVLFTDDKKIPVDDIIDILTETK